MGAYRSHGEAHGYAIAAQHAGRRSRSQRGSSPDGWKIALVREGTFTPHGILVMNADGSNVQVMFANPPPVRFATLSWSPDGWQIAVPYDPPRCGR